MKRKFGIHFIDIIDNPYQEEDAIQPQMSFCGLVVFICKESKNLREGFIELCTKQIISIVQERNLPFILCFEHTVIERNIFLLKDMMKSLRTSLEITHTIIGTDPLLGKLYCFTTL